MVKISRKLIGSDRTLWEVKAGRTGRSFGVYTNRLDAITVAKEIQKNGKKCSIFGVKLIPSKKGFINFPIIKRKNK